MSAIMSQNRRKMAKIMHNVGKKFDWVGFLVLLQIACRGVLGQNSSKSWNPVISRDTKYSN